MKKIGNSLPATTGKTGADTTTAKVEDMRRKSYLRSKGIGDGALQLSLIFPDLDGRMADERFLPNDYARSSLFSVRNRRVARRQFMHETLFHLHNDVKVIYTGQELRAEDDEIIWMQILHYSKSVPFGEPFEISLAQLLDDVGWERTGRNYERARECLSRLNATEIMILNSKAYGTSGAVSMIDKYSMLNGEDGKPTKYRIWIDPGLIVLFAGNTFTGHSWRTYLSLSPVGRRLADYIESHRVPLPLGLERFKSMCGSQDSQLKSFRETVRRAIVEIKTAGIAKEVLLVKDSLHFERFAREISAPQEAF